MGGTVRPRQVSLRAHFDEARGGALELLRLKPIVPAIKRFGLSFGGGDELHVHVVERVDEDDEALCGVAGLERRQRDTIENNSVIFVRDAQIIGGSERLLA